VWSEPALTPHTNEKKLVFPRRACKNLL
jgi:hypothetical protein